MNYINDIYMRLIKLLLMYCGGLFFFICPVKSQDNFKFEHISGPFLTPRTHYPGINWDFWDKKADSFSLKEQIKQEKEMRLNLIKKDYTTNNLIHQIHDSNSRVRKKAVWELKKVEDSTNAIKILEKILLNDPLCNIKARAASTLGFMFSKQSKEKLLKALSDTCTSVKESAALALARIGEKNKSLEVLINIYNNNDIPVKLRCHEGFKDINTENAIKMLKKSTNHNYPYIALDACIILAQLGYVNVAFEKITEYLDYSLQEENSSYHVDEDQVKIIAMHGLSYYIGSAQALLAIQNMDGRYSEKVQSFRERILNKYLD